MTADADDSCRVPDYASQAFKLRCRALAWRLIARERVRQSRTPCAAPRSGGEESEVFLRWWMQDQLLHQCERGCQIGQVEHLDG